MRQKKIKEATLDNLKELDVCMDPLLASIPSNKKITLEIGSGKGRFITSLANDFKDEFFIAVERDQNVCYRLAQKRHALNLNNLLIICDDAEKLPLYLKTSKADLIQLNFSDPWPKKRHHKRRLTYPTKLNQYKDMLSPNGRVILRTDHPDLFIDSFQYFGTANFNILECDWNLPVSDYMTEYEEKKRTKGPIYQLIAEVKKHESL
ncbi:tRNA (guanine-N(7)-)-methyltransferase [Acholeplasma oculi]|uniref:tRNA (guanine-N(7)-)-methyltransferase n=1 Tax=Acholeplasma oculi TaxID=35623 RepID=A0A061ACJ1_9MOLU|nr:tRNA (guanosine(46)-N7)-methyltransferase TrmB [Acholeplasma oculi]CDR31134.1 tRNA (guanine-N(7)-)-methyltransferase [Acholeplasma oculi]SKC37355.1 tRNA (guanine-N7-)-methyltransferase [Acholeplasma oculi]SUT90904.1 tRNA (guanine-N(7)-)-methyltransferase [Acholeplasma oculi]